MGDDEDKKYSTGMLVLAGAAVLAGALTAAALVWPHTPVPPAQEMTHEIVAGHVIVSTLPDLPDGITRFHLEKGEIEVPGEGPRDLGPGDNYALANALACIYTSSSAPERDAIVGALTKSDYYRSVYLPEYIPIDDTFCSPLKTLIFAISSRMIPYQRIDAEESLNPSGVDAFREAYGDGRSTAFRFARGIARAAITVPTVPLLLLYVPLVLLALRNWSANGV
jgi:hypothetical protein